MDILVGVKFHNRSRDTTLTIYDPFRDDFSSADRDLLWPRYVTNIWTAAQNVENRAVRGHSRSSAMSPFHRTHTTSYSTLIETMRLCFIVCGWVHSLASRTIGVRRISRRSRPTSDAVYWPCTYETCTQLHYSIGDCQYKLTCILLWLCLEFESSAFSSHADTNWCASVGSDNGQTVLYSSRWTDNRHYVCQYDRE